ncbi:MAG: alpha/beta hydrolase, partial [Endomicrobium sp.]|nr:alpha/beta hydrolase [Endomicrobium sp.]
MKSNKKFIALFLSAFLAISGLFAAFTPYPAVWLVKHIFSLTKYSYPENYEILKSKVAVERDINYNSAYPNGCLDVFYPKENKKDEIIFWVHGGGYVGDDKKKVEHYMTMLASSGYVVISINYALAPKYHYPVQLKQIE